MIKTHLFIACILYGFLSLAQTCPEISYPANGATDIPVNPTITWPEVTGINGYLLSIGTVPGGTDIVNRRPVGLMNSYTPPLGFPENTQLFVSISLTLFDGPPIPCTEISFTTVSVSNPPPCTFLVAPDNNAASVTIITDIVWAYSPTATGYYLSMGTEPNGTDLLDNLDVGNSLSYDPAEDLPQDTMIYVTITPYNKIGIAIDCFEEFFTTSTASYVCDPYFDENTGELIYKKPQINFPSIVGICSNELPYTISTEEQADGFRWFLTNSGSEELLLSETNSVGITGPGRYRLEAYNSIPTENGTIECQNSKLFDVVASQAAEIDRIDVLNLPDGKTITIYSTGTGQYEYALDNPDGPYQDIPVFTGVPAGRHMAFVRDKNGCGITQRTVDRDITANDFPAFFSPNGDGINDVWQFIKPQENYETILEVILIFDRYGGLIHQINTGTIGWDGTFNRKPMPESDYWYRARFLDMQEITGHFSLKR